MCKAAGIPIQLYGLNSVGLQRRGFSEEVRRELKRAYRLFFASTHNIAQALERSREELRALPEVVSCHMVSGAADFVAEIVVANLKAYERLLTEKLLTLPMIADIRSNFALSRVKSDAALPLTHLKREEARERVVPDC